jgi:hypothetical protein
VCWSAGFHWCAACVCIGAGVACSSRAGRRALPLAAPTGFEQQGIHASIQTWQRSVLALHQLGCTGAGHQGGMPQAFRLRPQGMHCKLHPVWLPTPCNHMQVIGAGQGVCCVSNGTVAPVWWLVCGWCCGSRQVLGMWMCR